LSFVILVALSFTVLIEEQCEEVLTHFFTDGHS